MVGVAAVAAAGDLVHDVAGALAPGRSRRARSCRDEPAGAAVTLSGIACTSARNTASAMRCDTSAAQPETGRG